MQQRRYDNKILTVVRTIIDLEKRSRAIGFPLAYQEAPLQDHDSRLTQAITSLISCPNPLT
jgi:hypothetical protein